MIFADHNGKREDMRTLVSRVKCIVVMTVFISTAANAVTMETLHVGEKVTVVTTAEGIDETAFCPEIVNYCRREAIPHTAVVSLSLTSGAQYTVCMRHHAEPDEKTAILLTGASPFLGDGCSNVGVKAIPLERVDREGGADSVHLVHITIDEESPGEVVYAVIASNRRETPVVVYAAGRNEGDADGFCETDAAGGVVTRSILIEKPIIARANEEVMQSHLVSLTGAWMLTNDETGEGTLVDLQQYGTVVAGVRHVEKGEIPIAGTVSDGFLRLRMVHEDMEALSTFVPLKVARQIVGITSVYECAIGNDTEQFSGTFYGFYAQWDKNNKKVILTANGGDDVAAKHNPPQPYTLTKTRRYYRELTSNGELTPSLFLPQWNVHEWYREAKGKMGVDVEEDGTRLTGAEAKRIGIMQNINQDVSTVQSLVVSALIRVDDQSTPGTGPHARTAPIALFVTYTDVDGVVHDLIGEEPESPTRMFWHGFYIDDTGEVSQTGHGTRVRRGQWYLYERELMNLRPRPRYIHTIGVDGSGAEPRSAKLRWIRLTVQ